jgi:anti-sigma B factor antagonist
VCYVRVLSPEYEAIMAFQKVFASRFEFVSDNRTVVIALRGNLHPEAVDQLEPQVQEMFRTGMRRFVFDLSHLDHTGSLGLRLFVGLHNQVKGEGTVVLCRPSPPVQAILEMTKLTKILRHYPTVAEAVDATSA